MAGVKGSINIKDNGSATLRNIRSEQGKLREDAKKTSSALKSVWGTPRKLKADVSSAKKAIKSVTDLMKKNKAVTIALKAKDAATKVIKGVGTGLKALNRYVAQPVIRVVDKASSVVKSIAGKIGKVAKTAAIPIGIAAAVGGAALGGAVSSGMKLEQQQISIEHFVGATNRDMSQEEVKSTSQSYIAALRENANSTPFETGEVIEAGSRAVSLANGDTSAAMDMVKLAEDMAAASGGTKSIMDAIEALGDLKVGETERLKEFGFKVSAEEFKEKGFSGVSGELQDFYGGAATKLASSGAGLMSTITGKLKSSASDFGLGVVEELKPVLSDVIDLIDESQPVIQKFTQSFGKNLSKGIGLARSAFKQIGPAVSAVVSTALPLASSLSLGLTENFGKIAPAVTTAMSGIGPAVMGLVPIISQAAAAVGTVAAGIGTAVSAVAPVVTGIMASIGERVGSVVSFLAERSGFIQSVISTAGPAIAEVLTTAWGIIGPVLDILISTFEMLFSVVQTVWPGIQSVITGVWSVLEPIFDTIGKGADLLAGAWAKVKDLVTGGDGSGGGGGSGSGGSPGRNASGTNSWKGGPTWVGEKGPELINLPRGTRILPTKESMAWARRGDSNVIQLSRRPSRGAAGPSPTGPEPSGGGRNIHIQINKIADNVTVRDASDMDELAERTAKRIIEELDNTA